MNLSLINLLSQQWQMNNLLQKVMEALHRTRRPSEPFLGVSQVGHDEAVFPPTLLGSWPSEVGGGRAAVVDCA